MRKAIVLLSLLVLVVVALPAAVAEPDCRPFCLDDLPPLGGDPDGPEPTGCRPYCLPNL